MKLLTISFLMALFAIAYTWESSGIYSSPDHPGKCVVDDLILSPGEEGKPKGECLRISCDDAEGMTTTQGCGKTSTDLPCTVGKALKPDDPYPRCCEMEIICPEGVKPQTISMTG